MKLLTISLLLAALALTGCGKKLKTAGETATCEGACGHGPGPDPIDPVDPVDPNPEIQALAQSLTGDVSQGVHFGRVAIDVNMNKKLLLVHIFLYSLPLMYNVTIDDLPGTRVLTTQDQEGRWMLTLELPFEHIINGASLGNPSSLPNGDPLPGIPDGELPSIRVDLDQDRPLYVYLGVSAVAIFFPTPSLDPKIGLMYAIKNKNERQTIGYVASIPAKPNYAGGFYGSVLLPKSIANKLDKYF